MVSILQPSVLRTVARLAVALLLIAQAIVAAHACGFGTPAEAVAVIAAAQDVPCQEHAAGGAEPACVPHCTASDQTSDTVQIAVAPMPACVLLRLDAVAEQGRVGCPASPPEHLGGAPPLSILYQVFRI
jgi:hypothetical protein